MDRLDRIERNLRQCIWLAALQLVLTTGILFRLLFLP